MTLDTAGPVYLDWMGDEVTVPFDPVGPWHEVYPEFGDSWLCLDWQDTNSNGIVDYCDWLILMDPGGQTVELHVEEVATDLALIEKSPPCTADINGDGVVDVLDLLKLLAAWGMTGDMAEDVNDDGVVDVLDLIMLLGWWGPCP